MKLLHTSDWHLGMGFRTRSYEDDQRFFIDAICRVIDEKNVDAVLLCGDVFDRSVPAAEAVRLYDSAVTEICDRLARPMFVIAGNHDNAARLASCRALLKKAGLTVAGELTRETERAELGDAELFLLPWFTTEKARAVFPESAGQIRTLEDAYAVVLDAIRARFTPGRRHLLMAHAYLTDGDTSVSDRAAEIGRAAAVSGALFESFDYVALGHLHGPQDIGARIRYSGTPMKYAFGKEERQIKSVTLLDTETLAREIVPLPQLHERTSIVGPYEALLAAEGLSEAQRQGYVRAQATDRFLGLEAGAQLLETYPNLLEYSGLVFERGDAGISMSLEELERQTNDPESIFRHFCADTLAVEPDEGQLALFRAAVAAYERGEAQ